MLNKITIPLYLSILLSLSSSTNASEINEDLSSQSNDFSIVFMGDPQLFRTQNTDDPNTDNGESRTINRWQTLAINKLSADKGIVPGTFKGVVINGDLTEYGHNNGSYSQFSAYQDFYESGKVAGTLWPGLGNHDYQNNVNDTHENNSALRMVHYMGNTIKRLGSSLVDADFSDEVKNNHRWISGSLSYAWDIGGYRFIQLHNYPSYKIEFNGYHWNNPFWPHSRDLPERTVKISSSLENGWLKKNLEKAYRDSKDVILTMHYTSSDHGPISDRNDLHNLMNQFSNIKAVFLGHLHSRHGQDSDRVGNTIGQNVPIYFSGTPIYSTMLLARFTPGSIEVDKYSTAHGHAKKIY